MRHAWLSCAGGALIALFSNCSGDPFSSVDGNSPAAGDAGEPGAGGSDSVAGEGGDAGDRGTSGGRGGAGTSGGGAKGSGGTRSGGSSGTPRGGSGTGMGGEPGTGGALAQGGEPASGGGPAEGGSPAEGGAPAAGGSAGETASAGEPGSGGSPEGGSPSGGGTSSGGTGGASGGSSNAGNGGGSTTTPCPPVPPLDSDPCNYDGVCTYGDHPRPGCRNQYTCQGGNWVASISDCKSGSVMSCLIRTEPPVPGAACEPLGDECMLDLDTYCLCDVSCPSFCTTEPIWHCFDPFPGCPAQIPNRGQPCADDNTECSYGGCQSPLMTGVDAVCSGGVWDWVPHVCTN